MTSLDEAFLLSILPGILALDPKYVVPRQGNWYNPQDHLEPMEQPKTWCAFAIEDDVPIDAPHYALDPLNPGANWSVQHRIAAVALQFVGTRAKASATSIGHWLHRQDVFAALSQIDGRLIGSESKISTVDFVQEGANTVKAYTVRIRIAYASEIETGQTLTTVPPTWTKVILQGQAS
jgi:hypothetical protein